LRQSARDLESAVQVPELTSDEANELEKRLKSVSKTREVFTADEETDDDEEKKKRISFHLTASGRGIFEDGIPILQIWEKIERQLSQPENLEVLLRFNKNVFPYQFRYDCFGFAQQPDGTKTVSISSRNSTSFM
jgi:hypothetical protein